MEDAFDSTYLALIDLNMTSSTKVESQTAEDKILDFGYPRSMADEMLYWEKRQPLHIKCFNPSLEA